MYSLEKVMGAFPRNQEDCLRVLLESFLLIFFHPAAITGSLMSDFKGGGWFRSRELQRAEKPHQKPPPPSDGSSLLVVPLEQGIIRERDEVAVILA